MIHLVCFGQLAVLAFLRSSLVQCIDSIQPRTAMVVRVGQAVAAQLRVRGRAFWRLPAFTDDELARIDQYAIDGDLNLWGAQSLIP